MDEMVEQVERSVAQMRRYVRELRNAINPVMLPELYGALTHLDEAAQETEKPLALTYAPPWDVRHVEFAEQGYRALRAQA